MINSMYCFFKCIAPCFPHFHQPTTTVGDNSYTLAPSRGFDVALQDQTP